MARHARKRNYFSFVLPGRSRPEDSSPMPVRDPGASSDLVSRALEAPDDRTLVRFLDAMRRWQAEEPGEPVRITAATVRQTTEFVLSPHFSSVPDENLGGTVWALREYLSVLADVAEAQLDTGRIVVLEMVARARSLSDDDRAPSLKVARNAASVARDLLTLLDLDGWQGVSVGMAS